MADLKQLCKHPIHFLSLGLGSGLSPKAPGTVGTVAALLIYTAFLQFLPATYFMVVVILSCVLGVYLCNETSKAIGAHDHPAIVWDEFAGFWIAVIALPQGWGWLLLAFVLFRIFDILRPWPISLLDKHVKGGFGIMIDDIVAGLFAFAVLRR